MLTWITGEYILIFILLNGEEEEIISVLGEEREGTIFYLGRIPYLLVVHIVISIHSEPRETSSMRRDPEFGTRGKLGMLGEKAICSKC
jgi:hypothetical protein